LVPSGGLLSRSRNIGPAICRVTYLVVEVYALLGACARFIASIGRPISRIQIKVDFFNG